jgi:D-arabinose 1-dehydrogenase-like Zn-dependent alcohol dehydrogenase
MASNMHAAVVEQFGKPRVLQEWEIPSPGAGRILVKTEACGVCHTDLHVANGDCKVKADIEIQTSGVHQSDLRPARTWRRGVTRRPRIRRALK